MEFSNLKRAHALRRANDMNGAFIAYRESVTQDNDANAHAWLSTFYLMGYGTDRDPQKAFEHAASSAAASNPLGKNNLGYCLQHGIGTEPDPKTAYQLFQESAATGNPLAYNNLGLCLAGGIGCAENAAAAAEYFKKSAACGDSFGMNSLGNAYYAGQGVPCDYAEAFKLFTAASKKGNPTATFNLACCFLTGNGTDMDVQAALRLFEDASEGGVPAAQYRMGCMCRDGVGCPVDVDRARSYFQLAADQGYSKSAFELRRLAAFGTQNHASLSHQRDDSAVKERGQNEAIFFEPQNTVVLSPPRFVAPSLSQLQVVLNPKPMVDILSSIQQNRVEQKIAGISRQNQELLKAASAIHMRYEAKVTTALKDFRREIAELEQDFSMRRLDEAIHSSLPLSTPAAGTLKSNQKGFKSRPNSSSSSRGLFGL